MGTYMAKPGSVPRRWYVADADGQVLGRLATRIAKVLQGKHRPQYTPHVDTGEFVVVVNAEKVRLTGRKLDGKMYTSFTGYPHGLRFRSAREIRERKPEDLVYLAVRRMLPKTNLGRDMLRKLKVYAGPEHPHEAQQPVPFDPKGV